MRYQKALGYLSSGFHVSSNKVSALNDESMLLVFDLIEVPQQAMSGMSTHGGNVTININGLGSASTTRLDVLIWHDV
mgnify:CR=1 FL=1